jgi:hypothetical protein
MKPATQPPERKARSTRLIIFRILTVSIGILIGLVVAEATLRLIEKTRLADRVVLMVPDPLFGMRPVPNTTGHDANGFRNDAIRPRVDIVALGDSQTWGVNVQSVDSWPRQLEKISGTSVYNMGVGGYGPVQYWALTDKALEFSPRILVVGLYLGNDLYDAYALVYANDAYANLRAKPAIEEIGIDTIKTKSDFFWSEEKNFHNNYGRSSPSGWSLWLREHSAIGRLLNRDGLWPGATDVDYEIDRAWARAYPDRGAICEDAQVRTVFATAYRFTGLNLDEPRVAEGLRITKDALSRTQQKVTSKGAKFLVLVIPTKELAYAELMQQEGRSTGAYQLLIEMENRVRGDVLSFCAQKGLVCVDTLPSLRSAIARREQIYPSSTESHPNSNGYRVLAEVVNGAMK